MGESPLQTRKSNLVFVLTDQWRRQALGFMNEDPVITPNLDRFAESSCTFTRAFAHIPICGPNRACLFSGRYEAHTGVSGNHVELSPDIPTLGQALKNAGYRTGYFGKWHLSGKDEPNSVPLGRKRHGFDYWFMSTGHRPFEQVFYTDDNRRELIRGWEPDVTTAEALRFIRAHKDEPFAAVLSFGPPHTGGGPGFEERWMPGKRLPNGELHRGYGYAAPRRFEEMYEPPQNLPRRPNVKLADGCPTDELLPGYFGACTAIDEAFGSVVQALNELGVSDDTIVVFTSDHGEMLGSQGRITKGIWYEEAIGVPLLIRWSNRIQPQKTEAMFNSIDLMPTLLGLLGIPCPPGTDGINFAPCLLGEQSEPPQDKVFLCFNNGEPGQRNRAWRGVRSERYTYVIAKKKRYEGMEPLRDGLVLYDNLTDPYQTKPIFKGYSRETDQVINDLHSQLVDHLERLNDPFLQADWDS
jgi:arylsulfatase A-like enzyme